MTNRIYSSLKRLIYPVGSVLTTVYLINAGTSDGSSTKSIPIICTFITIVILLIKVPASSNSSAEKGNSDEE